MSNSAISKPKSWTALISELEIDKQLYFPADKERSISAMISGSNRGGLKERFPDRKFTVKLLTIDAIEQTEVTRKA